MDIFSNDATAFVEVRGIGIAAFCTQHGYFQESMIRNARHTFELNLEGLIELEDGTTHMSVKRQIAQLDNVEITIDTIGEPEVSGWERRDQGKFSRLGSNNDPNDIRWILNLEGELHGNDLVRNTSTQPQEKPSLSRVSIHNAYFYTDLTAEDGSNNIPFFDRIEDGVSTPFGVLSEKYCARIKCEAVVVTLTIDDSSEVFKLVHVEGKPNHVKISNVDRNGGAVSDFQEIMKFLSDPLGRTIELVARKTPEKWFSAPNYCHSSECPSDCPHTL